MKRYITKELLEKFFNKGQNGPDPFFYSDLKGVENFAEEAQEIVESRDVSVYLKKIEYLLEELCESQETVSTISLNYDTDFRKMEANIEYRSR